MLRGFPPHPLSPLHGGRVLSPGRGGWGQLGVDAVPRESRNTLTEKDLGNIVAAPKGVNCPHQSCFHLRNGEKIPSRSLLTT